MFMYVHNIHCDNHKDFLLVCFCSGAFMSVIEGCLFRGCHRQPLYCFHFDFRNVYGTKKMADLEHRQLENWARIHVLKLR